MSSSDAPSAAVRTMTPPSFTSSRLRMSFSRLRSSSSSRRETPRPSPCGTKTTNRPGSEICVVSRAPFVFIGSLTAWTRIVWPRDDQVLDLAAVAPLELRADDLVDVEEAVLLEADLDERGLHPGQDVVDAGRGRCCRRSSGAPAARGRPRRPGRPRGRRRAARRRRRRRAARASRREAARGAAARGGGAWRLVAAALLPLRELAPLRLLRGSASRSGRRPSARGAAAPAVEPGFLRPRPPRLPRRRFGLVGSVGSEPAAVGGRVGQLGLIELRGLASSSGTSERWSSEDFFFRKRNQGK